MNPFLLVIQALNVHNVRYVVAGGLAVVMHGYGRATKDIDLIVDLDPAEARKAITNLTSIGLRSRVPVDPYDFADPQQRQRWMKEKNAVVVKMIDVDHSRFVVDLFIEAPMKFSGLFSRAKVVRLKEHEFKICSLEDLIELKTRAGRPHDLVDIDVLREIRSRQDESNE
jgi:predicted nucleotidyltransferase